MQLSNLHTHTNFCDGSDDPIVYAQEAIRQNMISLGYSAHASLPFACNWTVPDEKYQDYIKTIDHLKHKFAGEIEIYNGLEIDYIPDLWPETKAFVSPGKFDYFIGSIHFIDAYPDGRRWTIDGPNEDFKKGFFEIFLNDYHAVIRKYFDYTRQMVKDMKPPIIGHIDKIKMQFKPDSFEPENDPVFRNEFYHTLEEIAASNSIIELNTRGVYRRNEREFYPGSWALKEMARLKIPVTINSDAHRPEELTNLFSDAIQELRNAGYKNVTRLKNDSFIYQDINDIC